MRRLVSVLLLMAFLLSLMTGCLPRPEAPLSTSPTTIPTQTTVPEETTVPYDPDRQFVVNEAQLAYTLTGADFDTFEQMLADFELSAISLTDPEEIDRLYTELEDQYDYLDAQVSISTLLYYSDLSDTAAKERYLKDTKALTEANDVYLVLMRRIYNGQYAAKDIIFEDWTDADIRTLLSYTEEVMQIKQRNTEIDAAYQDLQSDPELNAKMIPLYIELVQNNNRLAQILGFDNYYVYAYKDGYNRDYGAEQSQSMLTYAAQYLLPAMEGAYSKFSEAYQNLTEEEKTAMVLYEYGSYDKIEQPYLQNYLNILPATTCNKMLDMFDGDILLMGDRSSAMENAFTTTIGPDRALCFFGPGCDNTLTVIHEVGHYYACQFHDLNDIPLDLAEVHSQGNEWLFTAFLKDEMSENLHTALANYKMFNDLAIVIIGLTIDAFEYKVYTHPDPGKLTGADLDQMMADVCEVFGGLEYFSENITDMQTYWRLVVVEQPVYYISYAVSALAAMDLYTLAQEDYNKALECYVNLSEKLDPEKGFLGNLTDAGIQSPFEEDIYRQLYELFANQ